MSVLCMTLDGNLEQRSRSSSSSGSSSSSNNNNNKSHGEVNRFNKVEEINYLGLALTPQQVRFVVANYALFVYFLLIIIIFLIKKLIEKSMP